MTDSTVRTVVDALDTRYPRNWAESWDRVGLVLGEFDHPVARVLCVVDCVPETVEQAVDLGADLIVAHHPLFLKPVSSIAPDTFKGRIVHRLIRADVALYTAHTNADVANPGVSDALAARLGLTDLRPLAPAEGAAAGEGRGLGRIGVLPGPLTLAELTRLAAERLPATSAGVRSAGDPDRPIRTVAVCGGAGDSFLRDATRAGVDAYLCADLRHHPVSEHLAAGGPALLDVAHWASERPWLDDVAAWLREVFPIEVVVSDVDTDPWTVHANRDDLEIRP
ncbi:dinuclear metal center YbgI/SA1388 family protein [Actinoplanes campanulatus]|uniref:GTP cyclohydrolase 1 type 2 homolog n=1 Tax=Actinoplanes campanulatus TaxID=113559 RepID=A0A7W5AQG9_9ACTN|nr:Nif3-like dinuclear metal center hexameric protein [Actinoplanes campanulatus]MBB3100049.1 dinuclear metal center YbgI/SA1388 family protein [Actinoplanes campanulatus]GGN29256.1 GTP cyclohydrolase 1 type 2 [Actinoplanes campanulatus]GID38916.1 GTP cyclohydrolase 1 type 2 [Actinoplanes campanulatus]